MLRLKPFHATAFDPDLTPLTLYGGAQAAGDDEYRETYEEFAYDLAAIQNLPEVEA